MGIKDTDDTVVAATLRALADLVPILGGPTVIGGKRLKLFANGAPKVDVMEPPGATKLLLNKRKLSINPTVAASTPTALPIRHEPDGGEDQPDDSHIQGEVDEHWSDWEDEATSSPLQSYESIKPTPLHQDESEIAVSKLPTAATVNKNKKSILETDDLSALDIQVKSKEDEIDYFADMQPTITPASVKLIPSSSSSTSNGVGVLDFNLQAEEAADADGWNWDD